MPPAVRQLGYAEIVATDVSAWVSLGELLGCEVVSLEGGATGLRIDEDRRSRIQIRPADRDGIAALGWETAGPSEFKQIFDRIKSAGGSPELRPDLAATRQVREIATFRDPDGVVGEIYWGIRSALRMPFKSPDGIRFSAGAEGFGHATMAVADLSASIAFYTEALGLKLTEIADVGTLSVAFFHANARHHSLAIAEMPGGEGGKFDHLSIEVVEMDHLGAIRDRLFASGAIISRDLGRHPTDGVISLYVATPASFTLEIGWGSVPVRDDWEEARFRRSGLAWGHRSPVNPTPLGRV